MADQKLNSALMSMTTEEMRNLLECPVCRQTFRNPKSLQCGHSVCAQCCRTLNRDRVNLCCPVCRYVSTISSEKLPINFGLRDLIQHHIDNVEAKKFSCLRCSKKVCEEECWLCNDCRTIVCCNCALRFHQSHKLEEIKDLVVEKELQVNEKRSFLFTKLNEMEKIRNQIDFNRLKLSKYGNSITTTVRTKLIPEMETASRELKQEQANLASRSKEMSAFQIISDEITAVRVSDFVSLPVEMERLREKQEKVVEKQNEAFDALRKCNDTLLGLISTIDEQNSGRSTSSNVDASPRRRTARIRASNDPALAAENDDGESEDFDGVDLDDDDDDDDESAGETNSEISVVSRPSERTPTHNQPANRFSSMLTVAPWVRHPSANGFGVPRSPGGNLTGNGRNVALVRHRLASNNRVQFQVSPLPANATNRSETVVVVDDDDDDNEDSPDDMDVGSAGTLTMVSSSAAGASSERATSNVAANHANGAQKRRVREESSTDSDDDGGESRESAIDSTIHFRILRKYEKN